MRAAGEMPEWPNGTDSKSVVPSRVPRVQIPISPPLLKKPCNSMSYGAFSFLFLLLLSTTPPLGGSHLFASSRYTVCLYSIGGEGLSCRALTISNFS